MDAESLSAERRGKAVLPRHGSLKSTWNTVARHQPETKCATIIKAFATDRVFGDGGEDPEAGEQPEVTDRSDEQSVVAQFETIREKIVDPTKK
jgi:hypothetical protein